MIPFGSIIQTTSGQYYAYNTATNQIITIDNDWYQNFSKSQKEKGIFDALSNSGVVVGETPNRIDWPLNLERYLKAIDEAIPTLTLELTQECTLRCEYCVYSGNYHNMRMHSSKHMDQEMIKKCIDYYAEHSKALDKAQISFYGGEALIQFHLIKSAVDYAKKIFCDKQLIFRISSNGTTLSETVLKWLEENENVSVTVTINGMSHDKYRRFPSGEGSLHIINSNIMRIKSNYPKIWDRIDFIANVASLQDLKDVRQYYFEYIGKPPLLITGILEYGGNDTIRKIICRQDSDVVKDEIQDLFYNKQDAYILPYYNTDILNIATRLVGRRDAICTETASCMPFTNSLFISSTGEFGICEQAGANNKWGNINDGINIKYVSKLLDGVLYILNSKCRKCWCQRLCTMCFKDIQVLQNGEVILPDYFCLHMRESVKENLRMFCELAERNPNAIDKFCT